MEKNSLVLRPILKNRYSQSQIMLVLEPSHSYQTLRYKIAWVDTRGKDISHISNFLLRNRYPVLDVGYFLAEELSKHKPDDSANLDTPKILSEKIKNEGRMLDGWNQPLICLTNLGILLEPDLGLHASNLLKDISKNTFLVILWDYFCDEPNLFHWGIQKQIFNLDFSDIGIKKIPFVDEI